MELTTAQLREISQRRGAQDGLDLIAALERDGEIVVVEEAEEDVFATPAAESLAASGGVDLSQVEGSGQDGRVLVSDVEAASEAAE